MDPIRCESSEFVPYLEPPHPIPAESCGGMTATLGGVRFIIDSGGFVCLPRTNTSGSKASISAEDTSAATLEIPPRSVQGGSWGNFDLTAGRKKRRKDLHRGEEERAAPHPRQSERGQGDVQPIYGRARSPYLSATEQLEAPCYLHSYIDPKDGREKSSHLLRNCRHFQEIRQFCDDLRAEATSRVRAMEKRTRSYSYPPEPFVPEPYEPMEKDEYVPAEVFPEPCGQVNMIHKTSFSKREIKKFSREVKYAEVAMVDTPDFIDWSEQSISFDRTDHPKVVPRPGHAALVLEAQIGGYNMSKVFMDGGSGLNLLFANTVKAMGLTVDMLRESNTRFHGIIPTRPAYSLGKISLDVVFGTPSNFRKEKIEFEVVDWESQYHAILGRPAFAKFMAVPHYAYLKLKMPGNNGTPVTVHGSFARSDTSIESSRRLPQNSVPGKNSTQSTLPQTTRNHQQTTGMYPRELAEHALNVDPTAKPVQQSMRRFSEPKRRAIGEEVNRLRKAGFIRELKEAEWVANPVMVPKKDTTALRMCINYTGLNKHCPKDHFPLPRIDQIVDSTAGCDRLSFLDAYSGYNQIKLKKEDQELTAFITPHGVFCYNVMTFGLKNAGATYQRCMQACLGEQIGRNIEVYIDDIVVKTKHAATLIDDLRETFDNLDRYKIKLNPNKCFFGVPGGQVLGYFISARGIEANPLKIKAILDMEPPNNLHQVQQLVGRLAALSRFIAKLGEKALPFYNLMKKSEKFEWTQEAQESFDNLKKILSTSPVLVTPREKETLLMYIAATAQVFSSVLVVEREEAGRVHGVQRPVYYLSEVLTPARQRYPHHQKLAYAVWRSARKLRHYFTEHPIVVVLEGSRKVRKKSLRKEESRRDSTSPWPANPRGGVQVQHLGFHLYNEGHRGGGRLLQATNLAAPIEAGHPLSQTLAAPSLLHLSRTLSEAPSEFSIATATTPSCCRIQGGATTSAARWNGEKDVVFINTERVTEYGGAARLWHRDQDLLRAFASGK
ncbi:hypothetical protein QYE76_004925 [Lolium multiflorum]|uniref:Uncharacterized protein n=1 Tax=Lolium multiflorum TaxID=4521 RepID=A0AAD8RT19_LOLMU|nr:hypothetical protein QYE76_004925 [Lolium multiflorum]